MKATAVIACLTYITATIAMAIQSPMQARLHPAGILGAGSEPAAADERDVTAPAVDRGVVAETQVPVQDDRKQQDDDGEDGETSCFCSGTSICCRKDGELDCGHGLCGVWI